MRCIKCFSILVGPDIILDVNKKYTSINPNKFISVDHRFPTINKLEDKKLLFVRNRPIFDMKAKMSMTCFECGCISQVGGNIKLQSQISPERFIKTFAKKRRF